MKDIFIAVLNMSITAGYVALAVITIRIFLKRIPKVFSYALWAAVGVRLAFPFSFSSGLSFFNFFKQEGQTVMGSMEYIPDNIDLMGKPAIDIGIGGINNFVNSSLPPATPLTSANPMQIILAIWEIIWISGIVLLVAYSIISFIKVISNIKTATLLNDNIFESDRITTPFVFGFIKPKIFIPTGLKDEELPYILAHEQTHIKRMDYIIKPLAFFILVIHWFNPLIWISFALMSKDMEMSCDESVLKKMGSGIKGNYASSLLSFSVKRSGLLLGSPLAFGESSIKSRIKNILSFKKTGFRVTAVAVIAIGLLITAFTANPLVNKPPESLHAGYNVEALIANKTPYVGDNSKVAHLIAAMPLPAGIVRDTVELQTSSKPYEVTINLKMNDASGIITQGVINGDAFHRNAILLFSLIDNVDIINCKIFDNTGNYEGAVYSFTYTREMAEKLTGDDVRPYAASLDTLKGFIDRLNSMPMGTVPKSSK